MKRISSARAKALQIPMKVKKAVYERDNGLCVVCGRPGNPEAHYVPRSRGGLGVEQNVVTLCRECHDKFDFGDRETMTAIEEVVRAHLKECYPDWNEDDLYYRKYDGEL